MTIMANHGSANVRETPHVNQTSRTNTIINAVKERAQAVINDRSIDAQSRAIIRFAFETNDPLLEELVRRADAGETLLNEAGHLKISSTDEEKVAALAELICRAGDPQREN
jgi:citrate lyase beta subunit